MTPDSSCRTRWSSVCSFFSSSFWKSSTCRAASRRLRSNCSCRSRRASGVISDPFFSSSSRSFSSSWRLPSISRCITAFSRSSCSRAATPAEDRASTRCTSIYAIRIADPEAGAGDAVGAGDFADAKEARPPEGKRQGNDVLDVAEYFARSAGLESGLVHGREAVEFEAADRVRTAEEEALEEWQRFVRPAESVPSLRPHRNDVAEPDRREVGLKRRRLDELRVAAKPGEVQAEHRLRALRRCGDHIAAVPGQ